MSKTFYNIGLDIGTNSVGWAVVGKDGNIIEKTGKYLWGSRLFAEGQNKKERRGFRSSRRRYQRRKIRLNTLNCLVKEDMDLVDAEFFNKMELTYQIKQDREWSVQFFKCREEMHEKLGGAKTIYHLRKKCMGEEQVDFRLVYLCLHHILKYRGNFLYEGQTFSLENQNLAEDLVELFSLISEQLDAEIVEVRAINEVAKIFDNAQLKKKEKLSLARERLPFEKSFSNNLLSLLLGYKADLTKIFTTIDFEKDTKIAFGDEFEEKEPEMAGILGEQFVILEKAKQIYSYLILSKILKGSSNISDAMIKSYDAHNDDLNKLKELLRNRKFFTKDAYNSILSSKKTHCKDGEINYQRYLKNPKAVTQEQLNKKIKSLIDEKFEYFEENTRERELAIEILNRIDSEQFLEKQTTSEKGAIPMQLHRRELECILDSQSNYYQTLKENKDKILALFNFRIPYFVGPLNVNSSFSWIVKKNNTHEHITPFNFEDVVDLEETQEKFIIRMLNSCEYMPDQKCMPKRSVTCEFFEVLQELNGVRVNGKKLAVDLKQNIIVDLFMSKVSVSTKDLVAYLETQEGYIGQDIKIEGLSDPSGFNSSLRTIVFLIKNAGYTKNDIFEKRNTIDEMIRDLTIFKEGKVREDRVKSKYGNVLGKNLDTIIRHKFDGWSRLSKKLVDGLKDSRTNKSILELLWDSDKNLMNFISNDDYSFNYDISEANKKMYTGGLFAIKEAIEKSYCAPAVKRSTWQTILLIKEIEKIMGCKPNRICVEFSSDLDRAQKDSRPRKLKNLYKKILEEVETYNIEEYNRAKANAKILDDITTLADEKVYLYYLQNGKCLYSGKEIDLSSLEDCEVDHIIPRSLVKDDSLDNKALVLRSENQKKKDNELSNEVRCSQMQRWLWLNKCGLLSPKKLKNLTANLQDERELKHFINRQLVETRQSVKMVIALLRSMYPDIESEHSRVFRKVVAVNGSLSSAYREMFEIYKLRHVNSCHHAHDAYISAMLGDYIYKKYDYLNDTIYYAKKTKKFKAYYLESKERNGEFGAIISPLKNDVINHETGEVLWAESFNGVIENNIYNRKCFITKKCEKSENGMLFKATINKASTDKMFPIKKTRLDTTKYGGYKEEKIAYFVLVNYQTEKKGLVKNNYKIESVTRFDIKQAEKEKRTINDFLIDKYTDNKGIKPLILNEIKIGQLLEVDGHPVYKIGDKDIQNAKTLQLNKKQIKLLYSIKDGKVNYKLYKSKPTKDELTTQERVEIDEAVNQDLKEFYSELVLILNQKYSSLPGADGFIINIEKNKALFDQKPLLEKIIIINNLFYLFGAGRVDMSKYGYSSSFGRLTPAIDINKSDVYLIDRSITGFYQSRTRLGVK